MGAESPIPHESSTCYMTIKSDLYFNLAKTIPGNSSPIVLTNCRAIREASRAMLRWISCTDASPPATFAG